MKSEAQPGQGNPNEGGKKFQEVETMGVIGLKENGRRNMQEDSQYQSIELPVIITQYRQYFPQKNAQWCDKGKAQHKEGDFPLFVEYFCHHGVEDNTHRNFMDNNGPEQAVVMVVVMMNMTANGQTFKERMDIEGSDNRYGNALIAE